MLLKGNLGYPGSLQNDYIVGNLPHILHNKILQNFCSHSHNFGLIFAQS